MSKQILHGKLPLGCTQVWTMFIMFFRLPPFLPKKESSTFKNGEKEAPSLAGTGRLQVGPQALAVEDDPT